jgi:hypothetical protein
MRVELCAQLYFSQLRTVGMGAADPPDLSQRVIMKRQQPSAGRQAHFGVVMMTMLKREFTCNFHTEKQ